MRAARKPAKPTVRRTPARRKKKPAKRRLTARQRAARQERRRTRRVTVIAAVVLSGSLGLAVLLPTAMAQAPEPVCAHDVETLPMTGVNGWRGEQLANAASIVLAAKSMGFDRDGQILGIMAAMGESSLNNIDYGDWETRGFTNPDGSRTTSIGLFQQQDWWGTVEQRMDPTTAASLFYARLGGLDGWQQMEPSHAIHRVQVNTDRDHYARYREDATAVVDALAGAC